MTPMEVEKLKDQLEKEKKVLEEALSLIATQNPSIKGDYRANPPKLDESDTSDENANKIAGYEEAIAVEQNLELRLRDVKETLRKISEDSYGVCDKCHSPIEEKRLKATAVARMCISCAKGASLV